MGNGVSVHTHLARIEFIKKNEMEFMKEQSQNMEVKSEKLDKIVQYSVQSDTQLKVSIVTIVKSLQSLIPPFSRVN